MNRNLDGCYFRVKRADKYENVCFSDLSQEERTDVLAERDSEWLKSLCMHLAEKLKFLKDTFDICGED